MAALICPFCGSENQPTSRECSTCGSPLPQTLAPAAEKKPEPAPVAPVAPAAPVAPVAPAPVAASQSTLRPPSAPVRARIQVRAEPPRTGAAPTTTPKPATPVRVAPAPRAPSPSPAPASAPAPAPKPAPVPVPPPAPTPAPVVAPAAPVPVAAPVVAAAAPVAAPIAPATTPAPGTPPSAPVAAPGENDTAARVIPVEGEEAQDHVLTITDERTGAALPEAEPRPPTPDPKDAEAPLAHTSPALPSALAGTPLDMTSSDEESPWLAIGIVVVAIVLVSTGIVYAISRLSSGQDPSSPIPTAPPTETVIPTTSEVENFSASPAEQGSATVTWTIPSGLDVQSFKLTVTERSTQKVIVSREESATATSATVANLTPGSTYELKLQVVSANGVSDGATTSVTPEGGVTSPADRDLKRRSDIASVEAALTSYYAQNKRYPAGASFKAMTSRLISDGFLSAPIEDPEAPAKSYGYEASADRAHYTITVLLEVEANDAPRKILTVTDPQPSAPPSVPSSPPIVTTPPTSIPPTLPPLTNAIITTKPASLTGTAPFRVDFTVSGANGGDTRTIWALGDGTNAVGPTASHIYTKAGTYTVQLTLKRGAESASPSTTVTVLATGTKDAAGFRDGDGDGLSDEQEREYGSDPNNKDTDADGFTDKQEINGGYNPLITNKDVDSDGDGIMNWEELQKHRTDPFKADTDGDGIPDGVELREGTSPTTFNKR